jgi:hypothetical protein
VFALAQRDVRALEVLYDRYGTYSVSLRVVETSSWQRTSSRKYSRLWRRPELFDATRGRLSPGS